MAFIQIHKSSVLRPVACEQCSWYFHGRFFFMEWCFVPLLFWSHSKRGYQLERHGSLSVCLLVNMIGITSCLPDANLLWKLNFLECYFFTRLVIFFLHCIKFYSAYSSAEGCRNSGHASVSSSFRLSGSDVGSAVTVDILQILGCNMHQKLMEPRHRTGTGATSFSNIQCISVVV